MTDEEIVIVDKEEVVGKVSDENVQAQWYGCSSSKYSTYYAGMAT